MMFQKTAILFTLLVSSSTIIAQPAADKKDTSVKAGFSNKAKLSVHARSFLMSTINEGKTKDYAAWAAGAGLKYETREIKNFRAAAGAYFIFNVRSSDLISPDSVSGTKNRYETGLFDITDPGNKYNILRLEELYLQYRIHHSSVTVGRQLLKTPFINPQDGRMRPTFEEGIWFEIKERNDFTINAGWLWKMSPRSVTGWYSAGKSIGLYPSGVDENGKPSLYKDNTKSNGIGILGIVYKKDFWGVQAWDTWVENIMNTAFLQAEINLPVNNDKEKIIAGLQLTAQHSAGNGGNVDSSKRYYTPGRNSFVISGRIGYSQTYWEGNLNYSRISSDGRFLMPREWGREPFYTFMLRERNEGLGDVNAVTAAFSYHIKDQGWDFSLAYGHFYLPDVKNYRLNKYGMPSYNQLNAGVNKKFDKKLRGLSLQLLFTCKGQLGDTYDNPKFIANKVDMLNSSLIVNYQL
jgi:hypothetical protein